MCFTECGIGVNEFTAGYRIFTNQITITETDDNNHHCAENQPDGRPNRTSLWKQGIARHYEAAPTDHSAEGKPPYA